MPLAAPVTGVAAAWQQHRPWLRGIRRFVPAQLDTNKLELETMTKAVPEQKREINHRARAHGGPDPEADLGASGADSDRQRRTSNELEPSRNRELAVILWVLASLIAEVELWSWLFARIYGP
jgi:hypothetical protein